ncbi:MAG: hypothetical protein O2960_14175 [Verrucomicrobia bacterium]|nr:hypothetical protein [Verrucomicrobiota bacterium]
MGFSIQAREADVREVTAVIVVVRRLALSMGLPSELPIEVSVVADP